MFWRCNILILPKSSFLKSEHVYPNFTSILPETNQIHLDLTNFAKKNFTRGCCQGRRQKKISGGRGQRKKQDRKMLPLSLLLFYQYHVWKSKGRGGHSLPAIRFRRPWMRLHPQLLRYYIFYIFIFINSGSQIWNSRSLSRNVWESEIWPGK